MLNTIVVILAIALAVTNLSWALLRLVESIVKIRQNPKTDTLKEIVAIVKEFFTLS